MAKLLGSSYTTDYVVSHCFPEVDNINEDVTCEIQKLENAKSFWSQVSRIALKWKNEEDRMKYPSSIFVKVPTITSAAINAKDSEDANKKKLIDFTTNEETFYRTMENAGIPGFPYPHYYHGEEVGEYPGREGCLVIEDFSDNVASVDYIPGFSIPQVECLIDALASWHAYVFEHPQITKPFHRIRHFDEHTPEFLFTASLKLESIRPDWFGGRIRPLEKNYTIDYVYGAIRSYYELEIPPVLVHMDMNTSNILWKKETMNTSTPDIMSIVDFQQVHTGNICEDIARIMQLGLSVELRRRDSTIFVGTNEGRLLDRYHEKLEEIMGKRNPVTLDQVHSAYRRVFPFIASFSLFAIVCYHTMYNEQEKDEQKREEKQMELLERAKGIVDDVYKLV